MSTAEGRGGGGTKGAGSKSEITALALAERGKGGAVAPQAGEGKGDKEDKFGFTGQVLAAVVVTAVAGNIIGARRFRKTMADTVSRNAQRRKAEADRAARAARDRDAAGGRREGVGEGPSDGHPLRGRLPKGWNFDDAREAAFTEKRLNSQVVQHLSTLGVKNFVAGSEEVKAAYRGKAMSLHPDRNSAKGNDREFKKVAESYAWLDDNYFRKRSR